MTLCSERIDNLALSYDNNTIVDGAGSQLHRIYFIYGLSRLLGVSYIHSPLADIPYQGLLSLEKNACNPNLVSRYNELFTIPSDLDVPKKAKTYCTFKPKLPWLHALRELASRSPDFFLLKISWPFSLVQHHAQIVQYVKEISPFQVRPSSVFKIVIHVRRGDLLIAPEGYRILPNSYYIKTTLHIIEVLQNLNIPFVCELHTETPSETFVVTKEHDGMKTMQERVVSPVTLCFEDHFLEEFQVIPHLSICNNHDPIETLRSFATADLLMMSRSSFSYVGAMLNKNGIIVYHPFWFGTPLEWLDATHLPSFHERLTAACQQWKRDKATSPKMSQKKVYHPR